MPRTRITTVLLLLLVLGLPAAAKESTLDINWPSTGTPLVKFSFGKFKKMSSYAKQEVYTCDVTATNLWNKVMDASFSLFFFDQHKVRIGEGFISLSHVRSGETVRLSLTVSTSGPLATFDIVPKNLPPDLQSYGPVKKVGVTIYSVPPGARLKVDGNEAGTTPVEIKLTAGRHHLEFSHEGYRTGGYDLLVAQDQVDGGSFTYELGGLGADTIELRDGTVVSGDLLSMDATSVVVRVGGTGQTYDRNLVKKIILVQRQPLPDK